MKKNTLYIPTHLPSNLQSCKIKNQESTFFGDTLYPVLPHLASCPPTTQLPPYSSFIGNRCVSWNWHLSRLSLTSCWKLTCCFSNLCNLVIGPRYTWAEIYGSGWQLRTRIHDNLCDLAIKSDTGQHSQFLRFEISRNLWSLLSVAIIIVVVTTFIEHRANDKELISVKQYSQN